MRTIVLLLLTFLLIQNISAFCEEGQVDINIASLDGLDQLYGIGPVKAQAIIDARPFSSVDSLIDVNGIGNATLNGIKSQGLACVEDELNEEENEEEEKETEIDNKEKTNDTNIANNLIKEIKSVVNNNAISDITPINLNYPANNTKDIKSEENSQDLDKNKIAFYGFFVFAGIIIILLIIRRNKQKKEIV